MVVTLPVLLMSPAARVTCAPLIKSLIEAWFTCVLSSVMASSIFGIVVTFTSPEAGLAKLT
ncbi:MAG: hypothetical protein DME23_05405 [Verrucomicrobia bacterium]|nr:MAG: hypothetical protein DME23_05405 [Verrucomicrobiota bacterium]